MTATTAHARPNGTAFGPAARTIATRTLRKFVRTPQLLVVSTIQGAMFLLIFRYVFGGAITSGGVPYVDFLVPGYVTTSVLFVGTGTAAGVAEDLDQGFVDRLRSLPIPRAAVLAGRVLADGGMLAWNLSVTVAVEGAALHGSAAASRAFAGASTASIGNIATTQQKGLILLTVRAQRRRAWAFRVGRLRGSRILPPRWLESVGRMAPGVRCIVLGCWSLAKRLGSARFVSNIEGGGRKERARDPGRSLKCQQVSRWVPRQCSAPQCRTTRTRHDDVAPLTRQFEPV